MADLPEFKSQLTSVNATSAVTGFQQNVSHESPLSAIAGSLLASVSQESARQAGAEAAQRGKLPKLSITGADREYVAAYKQEAFNLAYTDASKAIKDFSRMANADPSNPDLAGYQESLQQYVQGVAGTVPEDVRKKLIQSLSPLADSEYYSLSLDKERSNIRAIQSQNEAYVEQSSSDMSTMALMGNLQGAADIRDRLQASNPEMRADVEKMYAESVQLHGLKAALDKNDHEAVDLILRENAGSAPLLSYMAQYQASKRANENVNYLKAQTDYESGAPLSTVLQRYPLTAENAQKMKLMDARANRASFQAAQASFAISAVANDAVALAQFSNGDIDAWYDQHVQAAGNDSIPSGALIQSSLRRPIPKFMGMLSAALNNGNPEQMMYAAGAVQLLADKNAAALDGLSQQDVMTAWTFKDFVDDAANTPEEAAKRARYEATGLSPEDRMQRQISYAENLRGYDYTPKTVQNKLAKELGGRWLPLNENVGKAGGILPWNRGPEIPDRLIGIYNRLLTNAGQYTKNPKDGSKLAIAEIKKTWSETNINGYAEIQQNAPTFLLQNEGNYIQNDKKIAVKALADRTAQAMAKGDLTFMDIQYPDAPEFNSALEVVEKSGSARTDIIVNGHPAEVIVGSDVSSKNLSWPLFYKTRDGITQPLLDVDGSQARWYANPETPNEYLRLKNARLSERHLNKAALKTPALNPDTPFHNLAYGPAKAKNPFVGAPVE